MERSKLIELGFKELPHANIGNNIIFDLGRNRHLSIGSLNTPNEMLYLCERDRTDQRVINDLICLHNYDYDGYLTFEKLKLLLEFFNQQN